MTTFEGEWLFLRLSRFCIVIANILYFNILSLNYEGEVM